MMTLSSSKCSITNQIKQWNKYSFTNPLNNYNDKKKVNIFEILLCAKCFIDLSHWILPTSL